MLLRMTVSCLSSMSLAMILVSCGTPSKVLVGPEATTESAEARLLRVLTEGGSLYGLGRGCDEWVVREELVDDNPEVLARGRIFTRHFDAEGFFSHFGYAALREDDVLKAKLSGRGSRWPAPWSHENGPGVYCTQVVEIRTDPRGDEWVLVGKETWYFSRESCERQRPRALVRRACSDDRAGI